MWQQRVGQKTPKDTVLCAIATCHGQGGSWVRFAR